MILFINTKDNQYHIVMDNGKKYYYTTCERTIPKNKKYTTISSSSIIDNICSRCFKIYNQSFVNDPMRDPRQVYSSQSILYDIAEYHQFNIIGPISKFTKAMDRESLHLFRLKKNVK